ncbi:DUF3159 domain-containing protein [Microbacterium stercoris]|uniref:DUF3159 domain-containing protein n=1 Tax=Microbacterium stercoris TaxID=2820289 RepID=A0A939TLV2_9MICO|nr:DUF3159 domain-containing protein [Microbacterium stercoris]MBO3662518.1 DUF3159 domain-containing protein [Microbacterium stercoris]MBO3664510.1 DUF3159 domain-containing protein [Microbacterium stercoris]
MTTEPSAGDRDDRAEARMSASDVLGGAFGDAARRIGGDSAEETTAGGVVWKAMGGFRGVLESILPSLTFVLVYTFWPEPLYLSLALSVGMAAVFTVLRFAQRSTPAAALGGLVAAGAAAALALWTGDGRDNFVFGLITNAAYGTAYLVSAVIGWSLIGLLVGFLVGEGVEWRKDRRKRRVFFWLAIAWSALFFARLAVQLPLYLAHETALLGTLKLVMGLPLFAPLVAVTWLAARSLYPGHRLAGRDS